MLCRQLERSRRDDAEPTAAQRKRDSPAVSAGGDDRPVGLWRQQISHARDQPETCALVAEARRHRAAERIGAWRHAPPKALGARRRTVGAARGSEGSGTWGGAVPARREAGVAAGCEAAVAEFPSAVAVAYVASAVAAGERRRGERRGVRRRQRRER